ncbi:HPr kinase/phosphatase C-terminal domain-containing protein [Asaia sp. HN010]|uniref:HPr kinase/phosphorylase n=1 Tax=Asaia sp. HN010 TaxID=3081233 RepID=UPI0030197ED0
MSASIPQIPETAHRLCAASPALGERLHASCASWEGLGVLLTGASGCGKSSLLLRLIDAGFTLVGDDQVLLQQVTARPAPALAGLVEARGLGIVQMPYLPEAPIALRIDLTRNAPIMRLPDKTIDPRTGAWCLKLDAFHADSVAIIRTALRCIRGDLTLLCGVNGGMATANPLPNKREES